ncbi:MAG: hypothetical protein M3410_08130 [Acidobacteriota bacterium]|nr:hypothetical protein [Acidobacteriota bacterium]
MNYEHEPCETLSTVRVIEGLGNLRLNPPQVSSLIFTGPREGWPPKPSDQKDVKAVSSTEIPGTPSDEQISDIIKAASDHERVRAVVGDRYAYINTDLFGLGKGRTRDHSEPPRTRVFFYSYTNRIAVEVVMLGNQVQNVFPLKVYQPPEGWEEVQEAIRIARNDDRLIDKVKNLDGHAILLPLSEEQGKDNARLMWVTFTELSPADKSYPHCLRPSLTSSNRRSLLSEQMCPMKERSAMPNVRQGHVDWTNWSFDWGVSDREGLSLLNGMYKDVHIIGKLSLPVIRVKYRHDGGPADSGSHAGGIAGAGAGATAGFHIGGPGGAVVGAAIGYFGGRETEFGLGAGPYRDQIYWQPTKALPSVLDRNTYGLVKTAETNNEYVGLVEFTQGGVRWLRINVYARVGAYHILQEWYLSETGTIRPRVGSKGVAINMEHTHHPYWRLDFDIDGPEDNRVYVVSNNDWFFYSNEINDTKNMEANKTWIIRNERTGNQIWVFPTTDAGADGFSTMNVAVRRYHPSEETNPWPFDKGELGFHENEDVSNADVVFWYIGHLFHRSGDHDDHFHFSELTIQVDLEGGLEDSHSGNFIQSTFGQNRANFELLVPQENRLAHYWRDNDDPSFPWHKGPVVYDAAPSFVGTSLGSDDLARVGGGRVPLGVSLVQAHRNFGAPGPFVAVVRFRGMMGEADSLALFYCDSSHQWHGPYAISADSERIAGVTGP